MGLFLWPVQGAYNSHSKTRQFIRDCKRYLRIQMRKVCKHLTFTSAMNVLNFLLLIVALPLTLTLCQSTQAIRQQSTGILPVGQSDNWKMVFHDEFNGTALDTSKWTTCYFNFTVGNGCD